MQYIISRLCFTLATATAIAIFVTGPAHAVTISDCVDGGGIVVRCSTQPVTDADKIACPTPGKSTRIWCVGGFYGTPPLEILDFGGDSRYGGRTAATPIGNVRP
ncbi:hypothetical protein U3653_20815 [Nocardia sp. CDC186]|uniref:Secreted protein n=1 Tax=Nocardia implantans TaxID=3108168 RepID=A0ABU6AYI8_9NOCA|nr:MULTISPECIES: hypothetical protein [unclassified Nocardia]MBF6190462.1 hypothetical protein [Nocardia beijingensis]MEA3528369.1 hypothetical protein [Nocardia sp. CDC192]MEB3512479.1 hypothetical protein [Nocardia sp. CDC186]